MLVAPSDGLCANGGGPYRPLADCPALPSSRFWRRGDRSGFHHVCQAARRILTSGQLLALEFSFRLSTGFIGPFPALLPPPHACARRA